MKEIINTSENIFRQPMTNIEKDSAWRMGDLYFIAAEQELYRELSKDELSAFLHSAATIQNEQGLLPLMIDPTMPRDARVGIIYQPSYGVSAVCVYAYQKWPELFEGQLSAFLAKLLEGTFAHGIVGHGFEAAETIRRTLMMLIKAGARSFIEANAQRFPVFSKMMLSYMADMEQLVERIDREGIKLTEGFNPNPVNHHIKELVARWNGNQYPVFVYGTLMKGERAAGMLADSVYMGNFLLKDYGMYNLGRYPGIKSCKGESVYGELYFVDAGTRQRLDEYEGEGSLYNRTKVSVTTGDKSMAAEVYVYCGDVSDCKLMRQPWNAKDDDYVWYAGYGSNLSSKRFDCYIRGGVCEENGHSYAGAADKTPPRAVKSKRYDGQLYFGNRSGSWGGGGVAFFDPDTKIRIEAESEDIVEYETVFMRLYKITRSQLQDVMEQEGASANWYGRLVCLDVDEEGVPVYTLTSETRRAENAPVAAYTDLIINALKKDCGMGIRQAKAYVNKWLPK